MRLACLAAVLLCTGGCWCRRLLGLGSGPTSGDREQANADAGGGVWGVFAEAAIMLAWLGVAGIAAGMVLAFAFGPHGPRKLGGSVAVAGACCIGASLAFDLAAGFAWLWYAAAGIAAVLALAWAVLWIRPSLARRVESVLGDIPGVGDEPKDAEHG